MRSNLRKPARRPRHCELIEYIVEVTNRFKGLDLIECLMNYGQRFITVQEAMIKTIPKKKKCKKVKCLSEEALQIAVKRREVKSKGERE